MSDLTSEEPDRLLDAPHPRETVSLYGQKAAETAFLETLRGGRLPHGWLIGGPRGIGKATLAWRIARHLVAGGHGDTLQMEPDQPIFALVSALGAPQVFLCRRPWDAKSKRLRTAITVDEVRALKSFFQLTAADGGWRVAIVDAAEEMTDAAANALLKILEEPPARAVLLLVSHRPAQLLPTLRSRCRQLVCAPLDAEALTQAVQQAGHPLTGDRAVLAELAGGSVGAAIGLIARDELRLYGEITALVAQAPTLDRPRAIALAEACAGRTAQARYDATWNLTLLALSRLALAGGGRRLVPAGAPEAEAMARLARGQVQGRVWADLVARLVARGTHARAVHLDPVQVILDTFVQIDAAAAKASDAAA